MNNLMTKIHLLFLICIATFGNNFLKFKLIVPSFFLVVYFLLSVIHILKYFLKRRFVVTKNEKKLFYFVLFFILVILLSILGFYKTLDLNGIYFEKKYIIKQSIFVELLPIGLSMYICFINKSDLIYKYIKKYSGYLFYIFCILSFLGLCKDTVAYFVLLLMSYVEVKNNNKSIFYRLVTLILTILYISNIFSETTAFLMLMVYIGEIFLNKKILDSINSKRYIFYVVIIGILIFTFFNKDTINQFLAKKDANYWWRFNYWATEFKTLKESYFIGSGFGSTYASTSIFEILSGGFIDPETGTFVNSAKVLFTTAQHNSYMNIIYRTGIIGLILFLNIIVSLIFNYKKYLINNYDRLLYLAFINVNIIIGFNVGLESPQFLIPFYLSLFGLMSLEKKYKNEKKY